MIRAGNVQHCCPANSVLLRHGHGCFDFRQLARNHDLSRRINVRDIDVFVVGQLPHRIFIGANHRRHSAGRGRTRFLHQLAALLNKAQTVFEGESFTRRMGGQFA